MFLLCFVFWQDSANYPNYQPSLIDYFMLRSVSERRQKYNAAQPLQVLGPLSAEEIGLLTLDLERVRTLSSEDWQEVSQAAASGLAKMSKSPTVAFKQARRFMFAHSQVREAGATGWVPVGRPWVGVCEGSPGQRQAAWLDTA